MIHRLPTRYSTSLRNKVAAPYRICGVLFGLFIIFAGTVAAQTGGKISGTVLDRDTKEPLVGCNIVIVGTRLGGITDIEGSYYILNVVPGKYDIEASMIGYQKIVERDVIVNSGKTTTANFILTSTALVQGIVEIVATRPDVQAEKTSTSEIIRTDDVRQIAGMRDVTDVIGLAADITDGHFRGGRDGEELYTLQGMGIVNPFDATTAFVPILSAVEEVEVITSGFGAQYGNAQSGVVNITMKEGKADKWRTSFETRARMPGRKSFGPSVYDPAGNPYLAKLLDPAFWRTGDPENNNQPLISSMGSGLTNRYGSDTLVQLQVAYALWRLQTKRDLYRDYGRDIDYSVEGGSGGPINDDMRMFVAIRSNVINPEFPTLQPDVQRQFMGNVATDFGQGSVLLVSGGYSQNNTNVFPSGNALGFYSWLWDRTLDIEYQKTVNGQLGVRFSKTLSQSTFYELKLNALSTTLNLGSSPWASSLTDSLIVHPMNTNTVFTAPIAGPDLFGYLAGNDDFRNEKTLTVSFEASLTSQVTKSHLVNGGVQFNTYDIQSNDNLSTSGTLQTRNYTAKPLEAGMYVQDKMEFEGMIANIGMRFDLWNSNMNYYVNQFDPFAVVDTAGNITSRSTTLADRAKTPLLGRLQPRAGISFPVSVNTVFHLNYGAFMQRPSFQYIVATSLQPRFNQPVTLGNPRLEPQTTNSYDIGIMEGLGEGVTLDISGYYKDVKNLIEQATFTDVGSAVTYNTYYNRDYADIRGFRATLSKRRGDFTGSISYQYSVATGKSATVGGAPPVFKRDSGNVTADYSNVPVRDILLDFDRTHNLILNLAYSFSDGSGPELFNSYPLENVSLSVSSFARSGRPYTSSKNVNLVNGARTPAEYNVNMRLTKVIKGLFGTNATVYAEVFNVLNDKILNYSYLFAAATAGQTNINIAPYEKYALNDPQNGVLYWNATNLLKGTSFPVDQSFLIYDNAPRSFNLGLALDF